MKPIRGFGGLSELHTREETSIKSAYTSSSFRLLGFFSCFRMKETELLSRGAGKTVNTKTNIIKSTPESFRTACTFCGQCQHYFTFLQLFGYNTRDTQLACLYYCPSFWGSICKDFYFLLVMSVFRLVKLASSTRQMAVKWIFPSLLLRTTILYCINFLALQLMVSKGALRTQFTVCGLEKEETSLKKPRRGQDKSGVRKKWVMTNTTNERPMLYHKPTFDELFVWMINFCCLASFRKVFCFSLCRSSCCFVHIVMMRIRKP